MKVDQTMGNFLKIQMTDKENLCQNIYTDEIIKTAQYLKDYEQYAFIGKKDIPATCYTNFRDALFHFRKMVDCLEEHEIMQQAFAIREHLSRARTDAKTAVIFHYSKIASCLLKDDSIDQGIKMQLRVSLHQMKNIVLTSRINGMLMSETSINNVSEDEVDNILEMFLDLVQENCFNQFKTLNDSMNMKNEDYEPPQSECE